MTVTAVLGLRAAFHEQLHCRYQRHAFYNRLVWGGNETIEIDGTTVWTDLSESLYPARQDVGSGLRSVVSSSSTPSPPSTQAPSVREDVNARLWTDVGDTGSYIEMRLVTDGQGAAVPDGNNLVFESTALNLSRTGAFNSAVEFSADSHVEAGRKEWISLNDLAKNSEGVVVVSP